MNIRRLYGLGRLYLHGGLPPNIQVRQIPVHREFQKLAVSIPMDIVKIDNRREQLPVEHEDIELTNVRIDDTDLLIGFSDKFYTLFVGHE